MINVGDLVFVLPAHSLRFAGRWGEVMEITEDELMPLLLRFKGTDILYRFDSHSVLSTKDYYSWFSINRPCLNKLTGEVIEIQTKPYPNIWDTHGELHHFGNLLPVTFCERCRCNTTGEFTALCQDCTYPLPIERGDETNHG